MATMQDVRLVREVAEGYEVDEVSLTEEGEIRVSGGRVTESYDTAEEAIAGIRSSWTPRDGAS